MNLLKISRKTHKWLMLFLGVQFVIWSVSGAYMVIFDINYIHGNSLVENNQTKISPSHVNYSLNELIQAYPQAKQLSLGVFVDRPVYRFKHEDKRFMLDAGSGELLSPIDKAAAILMASSEYTGSGKISSAELFTSSSSKLPSELSKGYLPAWRINFDDFGSPSLYISARTGELVTKRHEFWRTFDLMFSLHVMDYKEQDISNWLLFFFVTFSLAASVLGLILTYYRIFKSDSLDTQGKQPKEMR
ncbi:hypothetical protein [Shewanella sp. UCD-KL12]|uniref:hypothetical protein n=1 Tax=Shewanella sp. UCD-KL12 TaxID=1917163 RepID=UPI0009FB5073|nr:hypothetical protein [Shewanella sp. UCD-KL12]